MGKWRNAGSSILRRMIRNSGRPSGACVCALLSILLTARLAGVAAPPLQTPAAPPARVDPLTVEFPAVSQSGTPFVDIKAEDVQIRIDGKQRQVRSLRMLQVGDPSIADASAPLPQPFGSNDSAEIGRNMLIVIEDESIFPGNERSGRDALSRFVNALGSRDRVGILTVPHGGLAVGLTRDHGRVLQALTQFVGRGSRSEDAADAACRSRLTLQSLAAVLSRTRTDEGPLTMIFLSSSMIGGRGPEAPTPDVPNSSLTSRRCELTPDEYRKVAVETAGAHAFFYIIQPEVAGGNGTANEPTTIAGAIPRWDNNRDPASSTCRVTGGPLLFDRWRWRHALHVLRETSIYYIATVIRPNSATTRRTSSLKTNRSGVAAHATGHHHSPPGQQRRHRLQAGSRHGVRLAARRPRVPRPAAPRPRLLVARRQRRHRRAGDARARRRHAAHLGRHWPLRRAGRARESVDGEGHRPHAPPHDHRTVREAGHVPPARGRNGRHGARRHGRLRRAAELTRVGPLKLGSLILDSRNGTPRPSSARSRNSRASRSSRPPAPARRSLALELAITLNGPASSPCRAWSPRRTRTTSSRQRRHSIGTLALGDYIVRAIIGLGITGRTGVSDLQEAIKHAQRGTR